jgi:hypothetical protein
VGRDHCISNELRDSEDCDEYSCDAF